MRANYELVNKQSREELLKQIYTLQKRNSKKRGHKPPKYSFGEFRDWALSSDKFISLYNDWINAGRPLELRPSCDRILDDKGYSFDNIQWLTYEENRAKPKGKQQIKLAVLDKSNSVLAIFFGINNAARLLNMSHTTISKYLDTDKTYQDLKFITIKE